VASVAVATLFMLAMLFDFMLKLRMKYTLREMKSIMRNMPNMPNTMGRTCMTVAIIWTMPSCFAVSEYNLTSYFLWGKEECVIRNVLGVQNKNEKQKAHVVKPKDWN
jgi:hypothetical protein